MKLHNFKNTKLVSSIGILLPLIISIILIFLDFESRGISLIYVITMIFFYLHIILTPIIISSSDDKDSFFIFIFNTKIVYTKYGNYFLRKELTDGVYECSLYVNKYWLFLSKVSDSSFVFTGDISELNSYINKDLDRYLSDIRKKKVMSDDIRSKINNWDGATCIQSKREKSINDIL